MSTQQVKSEEQQKEQDPQAPATQMSQQGKTLPATPEGAVAVKPASAMGLIPPIVIPGVIQSDLEKPLSALRRVELSPTSSEKSDKSEKSAKSPSQHQQESSESQSKPASSAKAHMDDKSFSGTEGEEGEDRDSTSPAGRKQEGLEDKLVETKKQVLLLSNQSTVLTSLGVKLVAQNMLLSTQLKEMRSRFIVLEMTHRPHPLKDPSPRRSKV